MSTTKRRNFLYTKSYTIKRLREAGFDVKKLKIDYDKEDSRYWSILVNKEDMNCNIIITCQKKSFEDEDGYTHFIIFSSKTNAYKLITQSADVIVNTLNDIISGEIETF